MWRCDACDDPVETPIERDRRRLNELHESDDSKVERILGQRMDCHATAAASIWCATIANTRASQNGKERLLVGQSGVDVDEVRHATFSVRRRSASAQRAS
jgi:hypothetical protein